MTLAEKELRIALLIDADNAPASKIDRILTELSTLGVINVRRAYGNWTKPGLGGWQDKLLEYAIRPIQQFDYSTRKNATDMAMTVDAMELFYADRPDAFGIVSSDADFTPLVMHLRSKGAAVYGFGAAQTPKPFVNACSRFLYLEALGASVASASPAEAEGAVPRSDSLPAAQVDMRQPSEIDSGPGAPARPAALRTPTSQLRQDTRLLSLLRDAVNASRDEDGWARVGAVGTQIGNKTSFDARNYGYSTLSKLLAATEAFEMREEGTPQVATRAIRPARITTSSALWGEAAASRSLSARPIDHDLMRTLPSTFARQQQALITRAGIHGLRATLAALALQRVSVADILLAVPELVHGRPYALPGVYARLRKSGVLRPSASGQRLFERHDRSFRLLTVDELIAGVQYVE